MSNLYDHAKRELLASGMDPDSTEDDPDKWIAENVLELIKVFADQGHSGSSAPYCIGVFQKLANFKPLGPLMGTDDEWQEVTGDTFQNCRCSHVFKENGQAYDIQGKVFREPNGSCYTNRDSHVPVVFPYVPKIEYIDVDASADGEG